MRNIRNIPEKFKKKLLKVMDPELNISVVDLGLIYNVTVDKNKQVKIMMTLTTAGCPLYNLIEDDIRNKIAELGFAKKDIKIDLTFDPPWSMERMSKKGKKKLGV